jgi:glycerate kinase
MRIVLAPDKFKGSLTAAEVAEALAAGIRLAAPDADIVTLPVADGGDGTVEAFLRLGWSAQTASCVDALGQMRTATYAVQGSAAVIEMASVCGLALTPEDDRDGLRASSRGLGQAVRAAVDAGALDVTIGLGGSASTDGGAGFLQALGAQILDSAGLPIDSGAVGLATVDSVNLTSVSSLLNGVTLTIASDVTNPLSGPSGAAAVFGPQKGLTPDQVNDADCALQRWADLLADALGADHRDSPGAGAAGGMGFACLALGAQMTSGVELVLEAANAREQMIGADLVVTGEGAIDTQTLQGKAPMGVVRLAAELGIPAVAVCGRSDLTQSEVQSAGISACCSLVEEEPDVDRCLREPVPILTRMGESIARCQSDRSPSVTPSSAPGTIE